MSTTTKFPSGFKRFDRLKLPMAANFKALEGTAAVIMLTGASQGCVSEGAGATDLLSIGRFSETVDNTGGAAGAKSVEVLFHRQVECLKLLNDAGSPVAANDVGAACWFLDNNTVTMDPTGSSIAGIVWGLDGAYVLFEPTSRFIPGAADAASVTVADAGNLFTSGNAEGALAEARSAGVFKRSLALGHADLVDADGSQTFNLGAVLPANARIVGASVKLATPFTGGGAADVKLDIGTAGDPDAIVNAADLFAAAVDGEASAMPSGIAPNKHFVAAGAQLTATVDADVNVADLTAGAATIDVLYTILA